ncbi:MAG: S26 family signal peptidase [Actinobacteria bacterium]|nr:S26 family signal peptidase [Actinomycetota bacterium]
MEPFDIFRPSRWKSFGTVAVAGDSMSPTYNDGDWLLVEWRKGYEGARYLPRHVLVIERESRPGIFLIKRYVRAEGDRYWVEGDNPKSIDSRDWGAVTEAEVVGRVLFRVRKANSRRGKRR